LTEAPVNVRRSLRPLLALLARVVGPVEVTARLFDGQRLRVVVPEIVGTELYRKGLIEPPVTELLLARLRPGMVFLDVGAQYGYFTIVASRLVQPSGVVVAFEPSRRTARLLRDNVAELPGVVVEEAAVGAHAGTVELTDFGRRHCALNTVLGTARVPPAERRRLRSHSYDVPAVALDQYAAAHGLRPDIVKLDAEGAELAILTGMANLLRDVRPIVVLETGDYDAMAAPATEASIDVLEDAGYACFEDARGLRPHHRRAHYGYGNLFFLPRTPEI
jgi:FkbM family methyltransferase